MSHVVYKVHEVNYLGLRYILYQTFVSISGINSVHHTTKEWTSKSKHATAHQTTRWNR